MNTTRTTLFALSLLGLCCTRTGNKTEAPPPDSSSVQQTASSGDTVAAYEYEQYFQLDSYRPGFEPPADQLQQIDSACAVEVWPTEAQIAGERLRYGENADVAFDDAAYFHATAREMLDSLRIPVVPAHGRYLRFNGRKVWTLDVRQEGLPVWNWIFFTPDRDPKIMSAADMDSTEIIVYFGTDR